jgi:hypothetical protein
MHCGVASYRCSLRDLFRHPPGAVPDPLLVIEDRFNGRAVVPRLTVETLYKTSLDEAPRKRTRLHCWTADDDERKAEDGGHVVVRDNTNNVVPGGSGKRLRLGPNGEGAMDST